MKEEATEEKETKEAEAQDASRTTKTHTAMRGKTTDAVLVSIIATGG